MIKITFGGTPEQLMSYQTFMDEINALVSWSSMLPYLTSCILPCIAITFVFETYRTLTLLTIFVGRIIWARLGSSFWMPDARTREVVDWWTEAALSGNMDDQIRGLAPSLKWRLDAGGRVPNGKRGIIVRMLSEFQRDK